MSDYQRGKIYVITDMTNNSVYYGLTTEPTLARRLAKIVQDYKTYLNGNKSFCTVYDIIKNGHYTITLVENFPCNSKDELSAQLAKYIRENECVNKVIPLRTEKEYRQDNKEKNEAHVKQYRKEYYETKRKFSDGYQFTYCNACKKNVQNRNMNAHLKTITHYWFLHPDDKPSFWDFSKEYERKYKD